MYDLTMELNFHDKKIFATLNRDLEELHKYYKPNNILGIFYDEGIEKTYAAVIPSFSYLCDNDEFIEEKISLQGNRYIHVLDTRLWLSATKDKHPEFINSLLGKYVLINPRYSYIYDLRLNNNIEEIKKSFERNEVNENVRLGIKEILRACLLSNSNVVTFLKQLTDIEKIGLEKIIAVVGEEGIFSQANLASEVGMSRVGMTNLILKLEEFNIAEIQRLGRGGTYCKFKELSITDMKGALSFAKEK